ncbi:MAG: DUF3592 domain-containing protein [Terriglobales bacterium]
MNALRLYPVLVGVAVAAAGGLGYWLRSQRKTPEQIEQARRQRISATGRITDGTVLDVREINPNGHGTIQLLIYTYDVGGVSYEAAQDITSLRQFVDIDSCRIGLPASVKYDPHNPGNSIVVAEGWIGVRQ